MKNDYDINEKIRESVMNPIISRLSTDTEFRNMILSILTISINKSIYEQPDTSLDLIIQSLLPFEIKRLQLNYHETIKLCLEAKMARVKNKETDKLTVHPIELLPPPESYDHWIKKGIIITDNGLYWNSIVCFDHAIKLNPKSAEAWFYKACSLYKLGAITTDVDKSTGEVWSQLNHIRETLLFSIECFDKAIFENRMYADAMYYKSACLIELGRPNQDFTKVQEAMECLYQVLVIDPSHKDAKVAIEMCKAAL